MSSTNIPAPDHPFSHLDLWLRGAHGFNPWDRAYTRALRAHGSLTAARRLWGSGALARGLIRIRGSESMRSAAPKAVAASKGRRRGR